MPRRPHHPSREQTTREADATAASILAAISKISKDIEHMSESLSQQIDAATAELQADLAALTTGVASLESQLAEALGGVTAGSTVTQAQVDALTAVHTSLAALAAGTGASPPTT